MPNKSPRRCRLTLFDPSRCVDEKRLRHVEWMRECRARLPQKILPASLGGPCVTQPRLDQTKPNLFKNRRRLKVGGITVLFGIAKYYLVRPNQLGSLLLPRSDTSLPPACPRTVWSLVLQWNSTITNEWPVLNSNFCVLWSKVSW
jgi:hypothetical protein